MKTNRDKYILVRPALSSFLAKWNFSSIINGQINLEKVLSQSRRTLRAKFLNIPIHYPTSHRTWIPIHQFPKIRNPKLRANADCNFVKNLNPYEGIIVEIILLYSDHGCIIYVPQVFAVFVFGLSRTFGSHWHRNKTKNGSRKPETFYKRNTPVCWFMACFQYTTTSLYQKELRVINLSPG